MNVSDTFNEQPIKQLIALAIHERDAIRAALRNDRSSLEIKRQIEDWKRKGGWFPCGETRRIYQEFRPRYGPGEFDQIHQEANAEVIRAGLGSYLLPKLEAAYNAHLELLDNTLTDFEDGGNRSASLDAHSKSLNALINVVNAYVDKTANAKPEAGTVRSGKGHRTISFTTTCVAEASEKGVEPTDVAKQRAEAFVKKSGFPGSNKLSDWCRCHHTVLRKAIAGSDLLKRAEAEHGLKRARNTKNTVSHDDPSWPAIVDEALNKLIEFASEGERAKLNTTDMRRQLAAMEPDELATLVDDAEKQAEKQEKARARA